MSEKGYEIAWDEEAEDAARKRSRRTAPAPAPASAPEINYWRIGRRVAYLLVFALIVCLSLNEGLQLRRWVFESTAPFRFRGDISRGFKFGSRAATEGYVDLYDRVLAETTDRYNEFDYAPLRLLAMRTWASLTLAKYPDAELWQPEYEFNEPTLRFNTGMEIVAALGAFFLTRLWVVRRHRPPDHLARTLHDPLWRWLARVIFRRVDPQPITLHTPLPRPIPAWRWVKAVVLRRPDPMLPVGSFRHWMGAPGQRFDGWTAGLTAALLLWFNPAMLLSAHGWQTWDMWIVPFYLWAVLAACLNWWFAAGMIIGTGALFKGQQWIVALIFILWPLFGLRPWAALRWVMGAAFAVACVAVLWMATFPAEYEVTRVGREFVASLRPADAPVLNVQAVWWISVAVVGVALVSLRHFFPRLRWWWWIAPSLVALGLLLWQWLTIAPDGWTAWGIAAILGFLALAWILPLRHQGYILATTYATAAFLCIPIFRASTGWFRIGWAYGSHHWEWMIMGLTSNVPGILVKRFGWLNEPQANRASDLLATAFTIKPGTLWLGPAEPWDITWKTLFATIYGLTLVLCAWGASRHERRNDPRFLVAMVAPWVMMFTILGQIHERYLLFAAACAVVMVAVNWGMVMLHFFMTVVTFIMTFHVMLISNRWWYRGQGPEQYTAIVESETVRQWYKWIVGTHPDIGWAVALCAGVFLYLAISVRPRREINQDHRKQLVTDIAEGRRAHAAGELKPVEVDDLMREIES